MINVIGLGYIGLPTSLMLSKSGHKVVGSDVDKNLIKSLKKGITNIDEVGIQELLLNALSNNIEFSTEYISCENYIITVPTPYLEESKEIDNSFVLSAVEGILKIAPKNAIIIVESTVAPGTIDNAIKPRIDSHNSKNKSSIRLVHAPERIIPGNMVYELVNNSRIIGAYDKATALKVKEIYKSFCQAPIYITDVRTAEMTKVVENTYRDVNIAFANELSIICSEADLDVYEIINLANKHPRVNILKPGPGVGGHCIPVDPWFLVSGYPDSARLVYQARKINDKMPSIIHKKIREIMDEHHIDSYNKVGIYGLSYKENIGDLRKSPTLSLLSHIEKESNDRPKIYDPFVNEHDLFYEYKKYESLESFVDEVEIIVIMVAHQEIQENEQLLVNKFIFDTKNVLNRKNKYRL